MEQLYARGATATGREGCLQGKAAVKGDRVRVHWLEGSGFLIIVERQSRQHAVLRQQRHGVSRGRAQRQARQGSVRDAAPTAGAWGISSSSAAVAAVLTPASQSHHISIQKPAR